MLSTQHSHAAAKQCFTAGATFYLGLSPDRFLLNVADVKADAIFVEGRAALIEEEHTLITVAAAQSIQKVVDGSLLKFADWHFITDGRPPTTGSGKLYFK